MKIVVEEVFEKEAGKIRLKDVQLEWKTFLHGI